MKIRYHKKENKEMQTLYLKEMSIDLNKQYGHLISVSLGFIGNHGMVLMNKAGCANYKECSWQLYWIVG